MCYHYALAVQAAQLEEKYKAKIRQPEKKDDLPRYHINAYQFTPSPVITRQQPDLIQFFHWGMIPKWVKSRTDADAIRAKTINARSESIFEKPSFRGAIQAGRRCLIPATGFYEWHTIGKKKFPFYIHSKEQPIFSFAGIWDEWADPETGEVVNTYSMLTTAANPLMAAIHNSKERMPCLLTPDEEESWLHGNLSEADCLTLLARQYPVSKMHSHSISKRITSRSEPTDVAEIMAPSSYPELAGKAELFHE
ncbi:SOS response-associated peptidase [Arsenicibacter rosenii]|uniref:Abasic site processing protein n=1 Tax=Arsenicibacter rosenii TaxID=1750698 RepID=A0A1S2VQ42_9BACT|nr:SOS response-associated peptidase [Arsenicibacter rosenii]OIN60889.1 hypothetical protein BLX24_02000 [Arsenicibacter rosenii]